MSTRIFRPEIVAQFEDKLCDPHIEGIERNLKDTLKLHGLPYTRHTLGAMLLSIKQVIRMGGDEGSMDMKQVFYAVCVERCLQRLEAKVAALKTQFD